VFTDTDGSPLHPAVITTRFQALVTEAGLPPIRLHDLRHGAATLTLATGADLKVVQDLLGHSSITITADGCDSVGWPHRDGGRWPHFATRRAVVTELFGPTR
jgi:hypothetical protein